LSVEFHFDAYSHTHTQKVQTANIHTPLVHANKHVGNRFAERGVGGRKNKKQNKKTKIYKKMEIRKRVNE
jgi:hypothetical protein